MSLICAHNAGRLFKAGAELELPKSKHRQGVVHSVKVPFVGCLLCGRIVKIVRDTIKATFRFYQEQGSGLPPMPQYDVVGPHVLENSTVSQETLWENGIRVPIEETPTFAEWSARQDLEADCRCEELGAGHCAKGDVHGSR